MAIKREPTGYKLLNPLDKFVSYSTHFIILAARTTASIKKFSETDPRNLRETLDAIDRTPYLGEKVMMSGLESDVYLVIDTRRFSQFTVQNLQYEVLINGVANGASHSNLATTMQMTILDSVGISFINYLQELMDSKMQTNFDGMVFLIKTVFVGHNEDGTSETVQSVTIPAHLFKMEVNLDYAKGIYTLEFMPNMNFDVSQHQRWLNIGNATTYFTGSGARKLGQLVDSFQNRLNEVSKEHYKTVNENAEIVTRRGVKKPDGTRKFGRLVQYQITIPDKWREFTFAGASANSTVERDFKAELQRTQQSTQTATPTEQGNPNIDAHMSTNWGMTIPDVLDLMFKQVPDIQHLANGDKLKDTGKAVSFYKHIVGITSTDDSFTVHVDVVEFSVPPADPKMAEQGNSVASNEYYAKVTTEDGRSKLIPKTFFELDYIFTGQNNDVLNFDLKIQDLVFLLASNTRVSEGEFISDVIQGGSAEEKKKEESQPEIMRSRAYDPLLIPLINDGRGKAMSQFTNFRNKDVEQDVHRSSQEYAKNLSAFYAISPITTNVTIRGNPEIMAHFSASALLPDVSTSTVVSGNANAAVQVDQGSLETYRKTFEKEILKRPGTSRNTDGSFSVNPYLNNSSYMSTPCFVNVVVKGPNVDPTSNTFIEGKDYATRVLFDNYYVVFKVVNTIENGVFTQQLELWSHNVFGQNKLTEAQLQKKPGSI